MMGGRFSVGKGYGSGNSRLISMPRFFAPLECGRCDGGGDVLCVVRAGCRCGKLDAGGWTFGLENRALLLAGLVGAVGSSKEVN